MAFMWQGFVDTAGRIRSHPVFKYLIAVPCLVAFAFAVYSLGRLSSPEDHQGRSDSESILLRARREVQSSVTQDPSATLQPTGGSVYIRWGRTECPDGTEEVYDGITGGSWWDSHGGGSNPLCLPMDPIWATYNENVEKASKIYGAEYQLPSGFETRNVGSRPLHDQNMPCVVCRSRTRSSAVMIPARNVCYEDWHAEYTGLLMSANPGHKGRSQFICVDKSPEADPAGFRDEDGTIFYNVEGVCGSLPCPPYVQRREFTCVVCSK